MTASKNLPWKKALPDLTKYDWMTAVGLHPVHKQRPLELRIAYSVMQHADPDSKVAWPSQQTLMLYAGAGDERQVRSAIASLCVSGALSRGRISQLDEKSRAKVGRQTRGKAYRLDMFWAYEVLEWSQQMKLKEPESLKAGRERHRTNTVLSNRTNTVRSVQDEHRPPNTKPILSETIKGAFEGKQDLASTREGEKPNSYAQAKGRAA
jgi:hypothetical protein